MAATANMLVHALSLYRQFTTLPAAVFISARYNCVRMTFRCKPLCALP